MTEKLWGVKYIHRYDSGFENAIGGLSPRVDVWNADENGKKSTWLGAMIKERDGEVREVGNVPQVMRRNLIAMLEAG